MWIVMFLLGIGGGMTSTIVGFGGGMVLSLALALAVSPLAALAVASVALVSGSIHRVFLYRHSLEAADSYRWAAAIAIGGLCGGMIAHHLPDLLIRVTFLAAVVVWANITDIPHNAFFPGTDGPSACSDRRWTRERLGQTPPARSLG